VTLLLALFGISASAEAAGTLTVAKSPTPAAGTVTGEGINCGDDCTQFYANDCEPNPEPPPPCFPVAHETEITASSNAGFQFASWSGCDTPNGASCSMTMDDSKTVTANYQDVQDPTAILTSPSSGAFVRGMVMLAATAGDNWGVNRVDFSVNASPVGSDSAGPYTTSWNSATIPDSTTVQVSARAVDLAGRTSSPSTRMITVDNTAPVATITGGPSGPTSETTPTFTFTTSDATSGVSTVECAIDGAFGPCSGAGSHTPGAPLGTGPHSFEVRATDNAGNVDTDSRSFTVETFAPPPDLTGGGDATPPETQITGGPQSKTKKKTASFDFSSSEAGSSFECKLDQGAFSPCTSPTDYKVRKGQHTFEVRATDAAGNTDPMPATRSWRVKKKKKK
jgi:hypothetical protein